ncbi:hypothetical protein GN956_G21775 [Arapaima gigas]
MIWLWGKAPCQAASRPAGGSPERLLGRPRVSLLALLEGTLEECDWKCVLLTSLGFRNPPSRPKHQPSSTAQPSLRKQPPPSGPAAEPLQT